MASLNGIPLDNEALTLLFSNWVNGPTTLQSGVYPSSPNGAYQNITITNCSNPGDGFVKSTENNGYFKVTAANTSHLTSTYKLALTNASKFTIWCWFTYTPNYTGSQMFFGNYIDGANQWYCQLNDSNGWKCIFFYIKVGNVLKTVRSAYSWTPHSASETLCLIMFEKDGANLRIFFWDGNRVGEVTYGVQDTYNLGNYTFQNTEFCKYSTTYSTGKYHVIQVYNDVFTSDQKTAIFNAGKGMGWYGYSRSSSIMDLSLKRNYRNNIIMANDSLFRGR